MVWTNNDGLKVAFGLEKVANRVIGGIKHVGNKHLIKARLVHSNFAAYGNAKLVDNLDTVVLPKGALILSAKLTTLEAFDSSGDAGTLTIGLYKLADSTAYDADGIDATIAQSAIDTVGEVVTCDGAQVAGVALTEACLLGCTVGTADFTAGEADLEIEYMIP